MPLEKTRRAAFLLLLAALPLVGGARGETAACRPPGQWFAPGGAPVADDPLAWLAEREVVLLGESHDSPLDHHWQYAMLKALHARHPDMAIGFEMFPRRARPALERWVRGESSDAEFLAEADWSRVWNMDSRLYMPLFRFARERGIPMLALNVERGLVKRIGAAGLAAVPPEQREGVGPAAPLEPGHRDALGAVFAAHDFLVEKGVRFEHFLEAQQFKDRAMAEALAAHRAAHPNRLVVGILGVGHLLNGHGVPRQLRALGQQGVAALATWPADRACADIPAGYADLLYVVPTPIPPYLDAAPR